MRFLSALAIALSSFLLFLIQPIMAKSLLPRFGGGAGVWLLSMLFFQGVLLAGYAWVRFSSFLPPRTQAGLHLALIVVAALSLLYRPELPLSSPELGILTTLLTSIGFPYFLLSTTSPLLQSWLSGGPSLPWRFFALSNAASLLALLSFPVLIEPNSGGSVQLLIWRIGWIVSACLIAAAALLRSRSAYSASSSIARPASDRTPILLAACASALWMSVANHLSREVAPVPFLWVAPLGIYLLTFILCFESDRWYSGRVFRLLLPIAWIAGGIFIAGRGPSGLISEFSVFAAALFVWCMFCHGEIAIRKPVDREVLPTFYLNIALGGALGAAFVAILAPALLNSYLELPISVAASILLALRFLFGIRSSARLLRLALVAAAAFAIAIYLQSLGPVTRLRNFYGTIQVSETDSVRTLYSGRTLHGIQFLDSARAATPTAYYGTSSGASFLLSRPGSGRRIGVVGLGAGVLAAYGRPGDVFRFYEINPQVIDLARNRFGFLKDSRAAVEILQGDGRLLLEREPSASLDTLIVDAFSDDSIPVHLLTREAFHTYFRVLRPDASLAIHITNRYLDLAPVVFAGVADARRSAALIHSDADAATMTLDADWIVVGPGPARQPRIPVRVWTDDYSNLFQILR